MRTFTHGGNRYLLGQSEFGYGIWQIGLEYGDPVLGFPPTPEGWNSAVQEFRRLEPEAQPIAPPPQASLPVPVPSHAGVPVYPMTPMTPMTPMAPMAPMANGMATAGGTLGIVGAVLSLIPFIGIVIGLVMGLLAIIFSGIGISRAGPSGRGKGLAITGMVLGILTVIFKLIPGIDLL